MKFDSRQCEAFLAVLDMGSFEQAAAHLHLTPSAVSQRIGALESALGSPLLVRSRPCRPTGAGRRLLQYLRRARLLEEDFLSDLGDAALASNISIAVNNDTLETWLLPAIAGFLAEQHLNVEIILDDQNYTYELLENGSAVAGISTQSKAMRGCAIAALGIMRYRMLASPAFRDKWFANGFNRDSAKKAPVAIFNRKDLLQTDFIRSYLGLLPGHYPVHYVPASGPFMQAIRAGIAYGMLPEQQYGDLLKKGELVDLAPGKYEDVRLFWHSWRVQPPNIERLGERIVNAARAALTQE
ncbi:LysR family transcriptional regulator ArgP [Pseudoduganella rhizocola]|uniref:LysR family transcriptional regulator ArgP n=1 Tax=Pseudoduganella rhizocola TaxID=3382643 RepID=UPI0038B68C9F